MVDYDDELESMLRLEGKETGSPSTSSHKKTRGGNSLEELMGSPRPSKDDSSRGGRSVRSAKSDSGAFSLPLVPEDGSESPSVISKKTRKKKMLNQAQAKSEGGFDDAVKKRAREKRPKSKPKDKRTSEESVTSTASAPARSKSPVPKRVNSEPVDDGASPRPIPSRMNSVPVSVGATSPGKFGRKGFRMKKIKGMFKGGKESTEDPSTPPPRRESFENTYRFSVMPSAGIGAGIDNISLGSSSSSNSSGSSDPYGDITPVEENGITHSPKAILRKKKDSAKAERKKKMLTSQGQAKSEGGLDDAKKRAREKRAKLKKDPSGRSRSKSPVPARKVKSAPVDVSFPPNALNDLPLNDLPDIPKSPSSTRRERIASRSARSTRTVGSMDDKKLKKLKSEKVKKTKRSSSLGPLGVEPRRTARNKEKLQEHEQLHHSQSDILTGSNLVYDDEETPIQTPKAIVKTRTEKINENQLNALREENEQLSASLEREVQRCRQLRAKMLDLKVKVAEGDGEDLEVDTGESVLDPTNRTSMVVGPDLREQLRQRDRRIADLERQVDGKDPFNRSLNSSSGSLGSIRSEEKASGDAIMQRLQTQLDEAHEELKSKDELLQTQSASLQLQTHRVAELEYELKKISEDTLQELKDEVQKLQDDKKSLEDQIQAERKESDERMKKKDEAVIFFQNELTKMKMNPGGNDPQRALLESSVHSRRNLDDSMHSTASATVHRAFGGLGALFGKEKVESDALSIVTPRMED